MEVHLQKNSPCQKNKKKVQISKKKPTLKKSANKEQNIIDLFQESALSVIPFNKNKYNAKNTHYSTPTILRIYPSFHIIKPTTKNSKIEYCQLPRAVNSLGLKSKPKRRVKKNKKKSKSNKPAQENSDNEKCDQEETYDNIDLVAESLELITTEESFGDDKNSNQNNTTDEVLIDGRVIPNPIRIIRSEPIATKKISKKSVKSVKKSKVLNAQERYKTTVPKPSNILENICTKCRFVSFNRPRSAKPRLAVIDLESIIYYFEPVQTNYENPKPRLFLNYFLAALYINYNLAFWARTSMDVLLDKLTSLGIIKQEHTFKICFCLDNSSIINSYIPGLGNPTVQPLEVIWSFYTQYNKTNTILIGNQQRNFYFDRKFAMQTRKSTPICFVKDPELVSLTMYLEDIARSGKDFSKIGIRTTNDYIMAIKDENDI